MPNYCTNRIVVNGDKAEIDLLKELILRKDTTGDYVIDYEIIKPMPKLVEGINPNISAVERASYEVAKLHSNRIGLTTPSDFIVEAIERGLISKDDVSKYEKLLIDDPYYSQNKPIEQCLEDSVRDMSNKRISDTSRSIVQLMSDDNNQFSFNEYNSYGCEDWALLNWGTKWSTAEADIAFEEDEHLVIYFSSAKSTPDTWFKSLCAEIDRQGLGLVVSLTYAEAGCWFGGCYERDEESSVFYEFDDDDIVEFLGLDGTYC